VSSMLLLRANPSDGAERLEGRVSVKLASAPVTVPFDVTAIDALFEA
jgi:hypothetical protein